MKRHIIIVDKCCFCKRDGEYVDHLLLHCDMTYALWTNIFNCFGMSWVMPRRVSICIFWCVWKEKNLRCFEDLKSSIEDILALFFHTLYLWTVVFLSPLAISFVDFLVCFSIPS